MEKKRVYYSLRSYVAFTAGHKGAVFWTLFAFFVSSVVISTVPLLVGWLVQAASTPGSNDTVMLYIWLLIAASSGHDLLWRVGELLHRRYINPLSFAYETMLFQHVIAKPYPYFVDKFSGKISSYVSTITAEFRTLSYSVYFTHTCRK